MKTLVITPGDPEGIGPEVTAKALNKLKSKLKSFEVLIYASKKSFGHLEKLIIHKNIHLMDMPTHADPGFQSGWAIEQASSLVLSSAHNHALITGPIHKKRLNHGGYPFQGHTDFLAKICNVQKPTMMLMNSTFRVSLVTQHCSIQSVPSLLSKQAIIKVIHDTSNFLVETMKIKNPKIAVLGLNPHAGESGLLGEEENTVIIPAIKQACRDYKKIKITGPHSADSFFSIELKKNIKDRHDAIIAMYHDQGLIPLKLMGFHKSINITLGLPIIRTSVDHGTAFDISGKNKANFESMLLAIESAMKFLSRSKK